MGSSESKFETARRIGILLFLLFIYLASMPRTIALEDDGLFGMAAHSLGIAHPPGFPLHTFLGKLTTLLPIGSVIFRMHFLSALFGALSCVVLYLLLCQLTRRGWVSAIIACSFGVSGAFWSQAIIAEVYTLNTFIFFSACLAATRFTKSRAPRWLYLCAALTGLGLSNHWPLTILSLPALLALLWPARKTVTTHFFKALLFAIAGLLPYLCMILRSRMDPVFSFYGPLENLGMISDYISRRGYSDSESTIAGWPEKIKFIRFFAGELFRQFAFVGSIAGVIGCILSFRDKSLRSISAAIMLAFLGNSLVLILLLELDYDHFQQAIFRVYPLIAYGALTLWIGLALKRLSPIPASIIAGIILVATLAFHWPTNNRSGYRWADTFGKTVLNQLEPNAIFMIDRDYDVPAAYLHFVEKERPDVSIYHTDGLLFNNRLFSPYESREIKEAQLNAFIKQTDRPVYFARTPNLSIHWGTENSALWVKVRKDLPRGETVYSLSEELAGFFWDLNEDFLPDPDPWTNIHIGDVRAKFAVLFTHLQKNGHPQAKQLLATACQHPQAMLAHIYTRVELGMLKDVDTLYAWCNENESEILERYSTEIRGSFFYSRAHLALAQQDYNQTTRFLKRSTEENPRGNNIAWVNLLEIYTSLGKKSEYWQLRNALPPEFAFGDRLPALDAKAK